MAKRDHETMIWDDPWFRKLAIRLKCLWLFILDKCDFAGFWKIDFEGASFYIGEAVTIKDIEQLNCEKIRVEIIDTQYLYVIEFIDFQYGDIESSEHPFHLKIKERRNSLLDRISDSLSYRLIGNRETINRKRETGKGKQEKGNIDYTPEHLREIWPAFLEMRKKIRKPVTPFAEKLLFAKLEKLSPENNQEQIKIVEQSIENSWQGLFELKINSGKHQFQQYGRRDVSMQELKEQAARIKL